MVYDVYAGGFHVLQANLTVAYKGKDRYYANLNAHTFGFLGKLAPWKGDYTTKGWIVGEDLRPEQHQSITTWRDEEETYTYNYGKDGSFKSYIVDEHDKPERVENVEPELSNQTKDLLSATMLVMEHVAAGNPCQGSSEIFDGKRRFKQVFASKGTYDQEESRYNSFIGKAQECTVEVVPVAGKWRDKPRGWMSIQEQGRDRGMMPTVWMAQISENAPAVPVKIRVKTAYGTLFMHLSEYKYGDDYLIADKRKS